MAVLETLNFVAFKSLHSSNPIAVTRRKLIAKIDEQIQLATNTAFTPAQYKWVTDADSHQKHIEMPQRMKSWWAASEDAKVNLVVPYRSKPLEFAKGKNAIELENEAVVAEALSTIRAAV